MIRIKFLFASPLLLLLPLLLISISHAHSSNKSITPTGENHGKWLVTTSIGGGFISDEAILALRYQMLNVFNKTQGGLYQHAIDIDNCCNLDQGKPTKENILSLFANLKSQIAEYKRNNPQAKTMVVWGLVGHGIIDSTTGIYNLLLLTGTLNGQEIADIINSLNVDEMILIVQSCYSGSLVDLLKEDILKSTKGRISVIVPVSKYLPSPSEVWENDILASSFDDKADVDGDDIISYEEWKNHILQLACQHNDYIPARLIEESTMGSVVLTTPLMDMGIDPSFFDSKMPGQTPLLLTSNGVKKYKQKILKLPTTLDIDLDSNSAPSKIWKTTEAICNQHYQLLKDLHSNNYTQEKLLQKIQIELERANHVNIAYTVFQLFLRYSSAFTYETKDTLKNILFNENTNTSSSISVKQNILSALVKLNTDIITTQEKFKILKYFGERFYQQDLKMQIALIQLFGFFKNKDGLTILIDIIKNKNSPYHPFLRAETIVQLSKSFEDEKEMIAMLLTTVLKSDADEFVRAKAAKGLGDLMLAEVADHLYLAAKNDVSALVRVKAQGAISLLQMNGIIP
ncbi:MAG: HEAT repeat domain-containing protein [Oligoflexia bacterium]|nr:HEAT repeat domain-containing protein [Oligoflexia bacterium]